MTTQEILKKYLDFFIEKGHKQVPNMSLVPENDATLLFVNSGMFPLAPYLGGEVHPLGKRLVNVQRSMRITKKEMDEIGDATHTTIFHMIGNWSLGDYFKEQQLDWAYELLIDVFKLDANKLYATVFEGNEDSPKDIEAIELLQNVFKKYGIDAKEGERIFPLPKSANWWQRGDAPGELGGPTSEVFYWLGEGEPAPGQNPGNNDDFLEIGNSVFMQFIMDENKNWTPLSQKNIDFGGGLERFALIIQGKTDIFETDSYWPIIEKIQELSGKDYRQSEEMTRSMRILADHARGTTLLAMDGVLPSNKDQGYILRKLIRRMIRYAKILGIEQNISSDLVDTVNQTIGWLYPELESKIDSIKAIFEEEEEKFTKTIKNALPKVQEALKSAKNSSELAKMAFDIYQSAGYPHEMLLDDAQELKIKIDEDAFLEEFNKLFTAHKDLSRSGAEQKFKGGLADHSEDVIKYHTATHLLHQALRDVLGTHVSQQGSNITGERLRFDFTHNDKLSEEEIKKVEDIVNEKIESSLPVNFEIMSKEKAEKTGALHFFKEKYADEVKVYYIGKSLEDAYSKEFCGGPHVKNTSEIGKIEIYKQESLGKGIRRLYGRVKK